MPVVKVYLPRADEYDTPLFLDGLEEGIADMITSVRELGLGKNDITVLFPVLRVRTGTRKKEIIISIELFEKPARTEQVIHTMAQKVRVFVETYCTCKDRPFVECNPVFINLAHSSASIMSY